MAGDKRIVITGGDQRGANFGIGRTTQHNDVASDEARTASLEALRAELADRAAVVVGLGRTPQERAALEHEVTAARRELAADEPRGDAVRFRWNAVLTILGTTLAMNADVAQITQFVLDLFS